ncbi:MAG: hypothetical protein FWD23_16080 [Oscillospiraceae bacterium]|nr:hypothetical protein [Oscillospiraceae bacterium]
MKRRKLLGTNLTFLITGTLAVLAFVRGDAQFWCLIGVFAVFGVWTLILSSKQGCVRTVIDKKRHVKTSKTTRKNKTDLSSSNNGGALLLHLNCRISDYIKSVYPEATWEWVTENPETLATDCGTGRIRLYGAADFNYADVAFDRLARIKCEMVRIVSFDDLKKDGKPEQESEPKNETPPNQTVNPETWYGIQGKSILETCVADLHARGHANLWIKENGDICVQQDNSEAVYDKFKNLPGRSLWQQLARIIENQGLSASVMNDCIKVSW